MIFSVERQYLPQKKCVVCNTRVTTIDRTIRIEDAHVQHIHDYCVPQMEELKVVAKCPICYVHEEGLFVEVPFRRRGFGAVVLGPEYMVKVHKKCLTDMLVYDPPVKPGRDAYYAARAAGKVDLIDKYFSETLVVRYERFWEQYEDLRGVAQCTKLEVRKGRKHFVVEGDTLIVSPVQYTRHWSYPYEGYGAGLEGDKIVAFRGVATYMHCLAGRVSPRGVSVSDMMLDILPKLEELMA